MEGEVVNVAIKATEHTTLAKLSLIDQFKLLLKKFSNEDVAELDAAEKLSGVTLRMQASLQRLFTTAAEGLKDGQHESVTLQVSSKYIPYMDEVIHPEHGLGRYYDFETFIKDLPINVDYMFVVKIRKKATISEKVQMNKKVSV